MPLDVITFRDIDGEFQNALQKSVLLRKVLCQDLIIIAGADHRVGSATC